MDSVHALFTWPCVKFVVVGALYSVFVLIWLYAIFIALTAYPYAFNDWGLTPQENASSLHKCLIYPFVSVSFMFAHVVHTKFFYKVHNKYYLNAYFALSYTGVCIPPVSGFGIREISIKIKSMFLLPYVFMNVLALSGGISIRVQFQ